MLSEAEWMFSSDEGRKQLHKNAGYERLLVVTLHREHQYDSLDSIKAELSDRVLELAPPNVAKQVLFSARCFWVKTVEKFELLRYFVGVQLKIAITSLQQTRNVIYFFSLLLTV